MSESSVTKSQVYTEDIALATGGTNASEGGSRRTSNGGVVALTKLDASHIKFRSVSGSLDDLVDDGQDIHIRPSSITMDGTLTNETFTTAGVLKTDSSGVVSAGTLATTDIPTGIDAANIADGSVSNTEYQYLNGLTSNLQTQIDALGGALRSFTNLYIRVTSNNEISLSADSACVLNSDNQIKTLFSISLNSLNLSQVGSIGAANGIYNAVLAVSTWYYVYVIYNGTTVALWVDTSSTAPTLPSGYTYYARFGAIRTDGSGYLIRTMQKNRGVQYIGSGTGLPIIFSGVSGTIANPDPTWSTTSISSIVPPTASRLRFMAGYGDIGAVNVIAAPNNTYKHPLSTTQPAPVSNGYKEWAIGDWLLESTNIYVASSSASVKGFCLGWEENL